MIVIWGVSGCGKSTVGEMLASMLSWDFFDADDYHPLANVEKMRRGIALVDTDRYPWLDRLALLIRATNEEGRDAVLACSALKAAYRHRLGINQRDVRSVHLIGSQARITDRLAARSHAFMNNDLLNSQFSTLEPKTDGLAVSIDLSPSMICDEIMHAYGLAHRKPLEQKGFDQ